MVPSFSGSFKTLVSHTYRKTQKRVHQWPDSKSKYPHRSVLNQAVRCLNLAPQKFEFIGLVFDFKTRSQNSFANFPYGTVEKSWLTTRLYILITRSKTLVKYCWFWAGVLQVSWRSFIFFKRPPLVTEIFIFCLLSYLTLTYESFK